MNKWNVHLSFANTLIVSFAVVLLSAVFLLGVFAGTSEAKGVESLGHKVVMLRVGMFGGPPETVLKEWISKNSGTEIVSFAIDKNNRIYLITK